MLCYLQGYHIVKLLMGSNLIYLLFGRIHLVYIQLESGDMSISGSENLFFFSSAFCGFKTKSWLEIFSIGSSNVYK